MARPAKSEPHYTIPAGSPTHYCRGCRARVFWVQCVRRLKVNADGSKHRCPGVRP